MLLFTRHWPPFVSPRRVFGALRPPNSCGLNGRIHWPDARKANTRKGARMMGILVDCSQSVRTSSHGTKIKKELSAIRRMAEQMAFVKSVAEDELLLGVWDISFATVAMPSIQIFFFDNRKGM